MKLHLLAATATLIALAPAVSAQTPPVSAKLGAAARAAIFKAAGAVQRGGKWIICKEDPQAYGANIAEVRDLKIGRASCRERVCQYVSVSVVEGALKNKQKKFITNISIDNKYRLIIY